MYFGGRRLRANLGMMKIVKRLDPEAKCNTVPAKPKSMHWTTYKRLVERYLRSEPLTVLNLPLLSTWPRSHLGVIACPRLNCS